MPIEIEAENSAAVGFIDAEFYQLHNYDPVFISGRIKNILDEVKLESPDDVYETPDGQKFLMSYFND